MGLSSFCVVMNALRLNLFKIGNKKSDKKLDKSIQENKHTKENTMATMEKTLKINGMMCPNCERHVREALEKIDGVESAVADHNKNIATVKITKDIPESDFENAIKDAGYDFVK